MKNRFKPDDVGSKKLCPVCGVEIWPESTACQRHANSGNPHHECIDIDEAFMDRVYDARDNRKTSLLEIDRIIGKEGKKYLHGTFNRIRFFGKAAMHRDQYTKLTQWLDDTEV
jgi:hypothetical protein